MEREVWMEMEIAMGREMALSRVDIGRGNRGWQWRGKYEGKHGGKSEGMIRVNQRAKRMMMRRVMSRVLERSMRMERLQKAPVPAITTMIINNLTHTKAIIKYNKAS